MKRISTGTLCCVQAHFLLDPEMMTRIWFTGLAGGATVCLVAFLVACSSGADSAVRSIPGTEQVAIEEFCITVSPDQRWLTFVEWKLPRETRREGLPPGEYHTRVASLNLDSGLRTEHKIESVPPTAIGFSADDRQWKYEASFRLIKERFRPPGWRGEHFYFQRYFGGRYVALDPSRPDIEVVPEPAAPGTCSDCPAMISAQFRDHSWNLLSNDVSAVTRERAVRAVYYVSSPYQHQQVHHRAIYRIGDAGDEHIVLEVPTRNGSHVIIGALRVSPDEAYLAYTVDSKKQALMSAPRETLFIRDLASGREERISEYESVGNLIWSSGSEKLYFAGGDSAGDSAIRIVDIPATFSR